MLVDDKFCCVKTKFFGENTTRKAMGFSLLIDKIVP